MKHIKLILLCYFTLLMGFTVSAVLSIEGSYQGKNLYVQNPEDADGFGYCATKVTVNGNIMPGGTALSAFEIDFSLFNVEIGEPVFIVIEHNDGCKPKILNPEVLLPRSTFNTVDISIQNNGMLTWKTTNEHGKLPFIIDRMHVTKNGYVTDVGWIGEEGIDILSDLIEAKSRLKDLGYKMEICFWKSKTEPLEIRVYFDMVCEWPNIYPDRTKDED